MGHILEFRNTLGTFLEFRNEILEYYSSISQFFWLNTTLLGKIRILQQLIKLIQVNSKIDKSIFAWGALELRVALCEALCACALQIIRILFEALRAALARIESFFTTKN
jgi:hypothetical protein